MIVTVSGRSGLTKAYTSVESATGSFEISGASRCDDMAALLSAHVGGVGGADDTGDEGAVVDDHLGGAVVDRDLAAISVPDAEDHVAAVERGSELVGVQFGIGGGRPGVGGRRPDERSHRHCDSRARGRAQ